MTANQNTDIVALCSKLFLQDMVPYIKGNHIIQSNRNINCRIYGYLLLEIAKFKIDGNILNGEMCQKPPQALFINTRIKICRLREVNGGRRVEMQLSPPEMK